MRQRRWQCTCDRSWRHHRRLKVAQLERENRMLRTAGGDDASDGGRAAVLDELLSNVKAAKDQLEAVHKRDAPGNAQKRRVLNNARSWPHRRHPVERRAGAGGRPTS